MRLRPLLAAALMTVGMAAVAVPAQAAVPGQTVTPVASTSTLKVVGQGSSAAGGWVAFDGTGSVSKTVSAPRVALASSAVTPMDATPAGGQWDYGAYYTWYGTKVCYSNYLLSWGPHHASTKMSPQSSNYRAEANQWATSRLEFHTTNTCFAYYSNS